MYLLVTVVNQPHALLANQRIAHDCVKKRDDVYTKMEVESTSTSTTVVDEIATSEQQRSRATVYQASKVHSIAG